MRRTLPAILFTNIKPHLLRYLT